MPLSCVHCHCQFRYNENLYREEKDLASASISYCDSGVDVAEGNAFVDDIKDMVKSTLLPGTSQIGGFGALIDFKQAGYLNGSQVVIGIDGVGTKIAVADAMEDFSGIGYDVLAMCVNDVLCHCSKPIAFLDYFVTGSLDRKMAAEVVDSIARACKEVPYLNIDWYNLKVRPNAAWSGERRPKCRESISRNNGTWPVAPSLLEIQNGHFFQPRAEWLQETL